jgi:hypothetical protein
LAIRDLLPAAIDPGVEISRGKSEGFHIAVPLGLLVRFIGSLVAVPQRVIVALKLVHAGCTGGLFVGELFFDHPAAALVAVL